jgi:hypothetical protein
MRPSIMISLLARAVLLAAEVGVAHAQPPEKATDVISASDWILTPSVEKIVKHVYCSALCLARMDRTNQYIAGCYIRLQLCACPKFSCSDLWGTGQH